MYLERVILGEEHGFLSWIIRALLFPLSLLYIAGLKIYLAIYSLGLRKRHKLSVPVICVGNLTFGGTGKTPAVQAICSILTEKGKRVIILSRGHGGAAKGCLVVSDGKSIKVDASESGDAPLLLAETLPGVPVIVGKDRRKTGDMACSLFNPDVILLDDGLQYWQLHRDLNIITIDAEKPFGSGFVMPMGDLREPVSGLARAGIVLVGNVDELSKSEYEALKEKIRKIAPNVFITRCYREPVSIKRVADGAMVPMELLRKKRVMAFCGIGNPASFIDTIESLDAELVETLAFADHHAYTADDLEKIENSRIENKADIIITTEKDYARLKGTSLTDLYVLGIKLKIEQTDRFAEHISNRIN